MLIGSLFRNIYWLIQEIYFIVAIFHRNFAVTSKVAKIYVLVPLDDESSDTYDKNNYMFFFTFFSLT